ncbi:unnamed protein product [Prorocentrum cordatum]|uniref:PS II complex 12 kDa extrinsic protein n=1 Tax=Prorocentrum cordatum TaxID=2364126 RepID=A0ABN9TDX4_9DINO|nr:unnamed protein product [Polarella glacialis]
MRRPRLAPLALLGLLAALRAARQGAFVGARAPPPRGAVAVRAQSQEEKDKERLEFMDSPIGQAIGAFAKFLSDSPLNDGKIAFAKMQAGDFDEAAVGKKVDAYLANNAAVMFSFSK